MLHKCSPRPDRHRRLSASASLPSDGKPYFMIDLPTPERLRMKVNKVPAGKEQMIYHLQIH